MYKTIFVVLALTAVAFGEGITSFQVAPAGTVFAAHEEKGYIYSYPQGNNRTNLYYIPPDSGGNWGDNVLYVEEGSLAVHEVRCNVNVSQSEQTYLWKYTSTAGRRIANIRMFNLGRQRAYMQQIKMPADRRSCEATMAMPGTKQFRVLIEVYIL